MSHVNAPGSRDFESEATRMIAMLPAGMIARGIFPRAEPWIGHFARDTAGSLHTIETIRPVATRRGIFMLIHPGVETPGYLRGVATRPGRT